MGVDKVMKKEVNCILNDLLEFGTCYPYLICMRKF